MLVVLATTIAASRTALIRRPPKEPDHAPDKEEARIPHGDAERVHQNQKHKHERLYRLDSKTLCSVVVNLRDPDVADDVVNQGQRYVEEHEKPDPEGGRREVVRDDQEDLDQEEVQVRQRKPTQQVALAEIRVVVFLHACH